MAIKEGGGAPNDPPPPNRLGLKHLLWICSVDPKNITILDVQ